MSQPDIKDVHMTTVPSKGEGTCPNCGKPMKNGKCLYCAGKDMKKSPTLPTVMYKTVRETLAGVELVSDVLLAKYNKNHDNKGRFASSPGGGGGGGAPKGGGVPGGGGAGGGEGGGQGKPKAKSKGPDAPGSSAKIDKDLEDLKAAKDNGVEDVEDHLVAVSNLRSLGVHIGGDASNPKDDKHALMTMLDEAYGSDDDPDDARGALKNWLGKELPELAAKAKAGDAKALASLKEQVGESGLNMDKLGVKSRKFK